jgi:regulator of cell morphogenesis and NO signaling
MYHRNWSKESLMELLEYIEQHHCEIKEKLLKLQTLIKQAAELQKDKYSSTFASLQKFYPVFKTEMENHFAKEEHILIPYIRQMDEFNRNPGTKLELQHNSIKNPISELEYDHDRAENVMFDELRTITSNYQLPQNASDAFKALYDCLKDIETNISEHINLENKMLFPWAIKLELQLIDKR